MQAALGLSQLDRLEDVVSRRREIAGHYDDALSDLPLKIPGRQEGARSSWHLYVIRLDKSESQRVVFDYLREAGIGVNLHYIPIHLHPYYRQFGYSPGDYPAAEDYYERAISIPLHPGLSDSELHRVISDVSAVL